ncbi:MAG: ATP-binding protein [Thermoanaerobaculia bacterium]|nr:ATP-binding protein [Thermoanaerobaculia bacterium]
MSKRRIAFLGLALFLTVLLAGFAGTSFERRLTSFEPLGVEVTQKENAWQVESVTVESTGLLAGDQILTVEGETPRNLEELRSSLRARPEAGLLVVRGQELVEVAYARPGLQIGWSYLVVALIGVFYLVVGLITALKDHNLHARLFFFWCWTSAALYILSPVMPPVTAGDEWIFAFDQLARLLLPALTLHLFLTFPTRLSSNPWLGRVIPALYVPSAFFGLYHFEQIPRFSLSGGRLFGPVTDAQLLLVDRLELLWLLVCVVLSIGVVALRFRRSSGWEHRRQTQWILTGLLAGYAPFTVLYLVPFALGLRWPEWTSVLAVLPLALVPLAFAWAILKYKLLDLDVILRDVVSWTATGMVGIFGFELVHLVIQANVPAEQALGRNVLTFAAGLTLAAVLIPTRRTLADRLESWQHGGRIGPRRQLRGLGHELLFQRNLDRLCADLIEGLEDALVARANLYLVQGSEGLAPVKLPPQDQQSASGTWNSAPSTKRDSGDEGIPRFLGFDDLGGDLWNRDVESISAIQLSTEQLSASQRLFLAGFRYAFPMTVRGHRIGVLVMGYKFDDEPLAGEDIDLVTSVLDRAALAIENAQLLEEVHLRLDEVQQLESYNEGILESTPAGIAVLDDGDTVISVNHAFAALCGFERPRAVGRNIADLLPVRPLPKSGEGLVEVAWCEPSGAERYMQLSVASWSDSGDDGGRRVLVAQDVSARVTMELELKEKEHLASLGVLAAGVAHEVNTPLTGISSYAQFLLADTPEDDPHFAILKKMERQTFRAAQIVNNLLDFARNRHGETSKVDFACLIGDCLHLLEERADRVGVDIDYSRPDGEYDVLGNESELHQVITNLVVNAFEAMANQDEARLVRLRVDRHVHRIRLRISDTGPGVAGERLDSIFKPFFSSKLEQGGSGLGLAITYNIVRRHGGEVSVENHEGKRGCTFTVELPQHAPEITDAGAAR